MLIISAMLLTPIKGMTDCKEQLASCEEVIVAADAAIQQQQRLIGLQSDQISDLKFNYKIVRAELEERNLELGAWYRQPAIIVPLSFILGAYVFSQVGR